MKNSGFAYRNLQKLDKDILENFILYRFNHFYNILEFLKIEYF